MAVAAGPSLGEPGLSLTPSSSASREIVARSSGSSSDLRSASATMTSASVRRSRPEICLTCPKSMRPMVPSSMTKTLPGCGSAWKKPPSRMVRPKASVSDDSSRRPNSCASGPSGSMPFFCIVSSARESGSPGK
eukprot:scaffold100071_cov69-Phaeocystis_antarctica.AAC.4